MAGRRRTEEVEKAEHVTQSYDDFPNTSILNGGKFDGLVFQGVVGF